MYGKIKTFTSIAIATMLAGTAMAQTTTVTVAGRTWEVKAGRALVFAQDGTPSYADSDAPHLVAAEAPRTATQPARARGPEGPTDALPDSAFRAPATPEDMTPVQPVAERPAAVAQPAAAPVAIPAAYVDHHWSAGLMVPKPAADGSFATPNVSLSQAASVWHLRVALNVAALACRGAEGERLTTGYNAFLTGHAKELAVAENALAREYGANRAEGRAAYDTSMTRLYNFFATPAAHEAFCATATKAIEDLEAADLAKAEFGGACIKTLAKLDQPFVDFYREYDAWRSSSAAGTRTASADAAPSPTTQNGSGTTLQPVSLASK